MQSLLRDQDNIDHGFEQGLEQKTIETVKNGLTNNVPLDMIMVMSGLSKKEIEEIRQKIQ